MPRVLGKDLGTPFAVPSDKTPNMLPRQTKYISSSSDVKTLCDTFAANGVNTKAVNARKGRRVAVESRTKAGARVFVYQPEGLVDSAPRRFRWTKAYLSA